MPNPIVGIGNSFEFASVLSPTTFTTLAGVTDITPSGDKVTTEKTTTMATTGGVDTFIASTQDSGSMDIKGFFLPGDATQVALEAIRLAGTAVAMKALYGSSNSLSFTGIVESFTPSFPLEKPASFSLKIKISGPKTYV
jgi:hypothetical protein